MRFRNWFESTEKKIVSVLLYPCHGLKGHTKDRHRWMVTELYDDGTKQEDFREFDSIEEAKNYYVKILGSIRVSEYKNRPALPGAPVDSWFGKSDYIGEPDPNFFITGSHGICKQCQEINRRINPVSPEVEAAVQRMMANRKKT